MNTVPTAYEMRKFSRIVLIRSIRGRNSYKILIVFSFTTNWANFLMKY